MDSNTEGVKCWGHQWRSGVCLLTQNYQKKRISGYDFNGELKQGVKISVLRNGSLGQTIEEKVIAQIEHRKPQGKWDDEPNEIYFEATLL